MAPAAIWLAALCGSLLIGGLLPARAADRGAAAPQSTEAYPAAMDARLGGDEARTRFILDLSRTVELTAFTLADPYRVVVDLPQITFTLPPRAGQTGRGLIKAFRFGLVMQGGSRIVIDATRPVRIEQTFMLPPVDGQPARLVIDLVGTDRDSFLRALATENRPRRPLEAPRRQEHDAAVHATDTRPLIMIDPGHGGPDTGTVAKDGTTEKEIVLEFALALREKLEKSGKYRVAMTRTDDHFIPLNDRVRIARSNQAALFISIHADALPRRGEARGAAVYTRAEKASDADAARLAEQENKADLIAGVDLTGEPDGVVDILVDLAHRETRSFSLHFARTLLGQLKGATRLHKHPMKAAGFVVLKAHDVPSVLVELGYVTSRADLKLLTSEAWRERTAESMSRAVHDFFATRLAGSAAKPAAE
jgi:N-acetylmuramoyl-L-alanine amidase